MEAGLARSCGVRDVGFLWIRTAVGASAPMGGERVGEHPKRSSRGCTARCRAPHWGRALPSRGGVPGMDLARFGPGTYVITFTSQEGTCYERVVVE